MNVLLSLLMVISLSVSAVASAEPFPSRPIKIVVPYGPGSGADLIARIVASRLTKDLGVATVIENRDAAGSLVGSRDVMMSPPDGYTLLLAATPFVVAPHLQPKLPYDPTRDFVAVAKVGVLPMALVTSPTTFGSFQDLVKYSKANPGKINYASAGKGTPSHLEMERIKQILGLQIPDVPYKNAGQAMTDTIGGQVALYFPTLPAAIVQRGAGRVRILAVGSPARLPQAPDIPTLSEALDRPGYQANVWYGFVARAGTPSDILSKLSDSLAKTLNQSDVRERIEKTGAHVEFADAPSFAAQIEEENNKWSKLVKALALTSLN